MATGSAEPRSKGRTGRPWRRNRGRMVQRWRHNSTPCWLCGNPIDWDLPYRDPVSGAVNPMFGTVDHLDPISLGGKPLDTARWAPAHMVCNARRGNCTAHQRVGPTGPASRRW